VDTAELVNYCRRRRRRLHRHRRRREKREAIGACDPGTTESVSKAIASFNLHHFIILSLHIFSILELTS